MSQTATRYADVLIIGAGVSGVGMAAHLSRDCPWVSYLVLERREAIGGTWDLFRYPGVRSDSDMFTFGYNFRPWTQDKVLADGASIRGYVQATAAQYGVGEHVVFGKRVRRASWSTPAGRWQVEVEDVATGSTESYSCRFLVGATGYYDYDAGYRPEFPGEADFGGTVVHPQHWPADLDYTGKRVVVIGSGATAITLVPAMAERAAHVTMLQRSPTYVMSLPGTDHLAARLRTVLPEMAVYRLGRARNILLQRGSYAFSRRFPATARKLIVGGVAKQLRVPADSPQLRHFSPSYDPWDQRLCIVPDGDLFAAIRKGKASVCTDTVDTFTPRGIRLTSGEELPADIIVTATGLRIQMLGGTELVVDGSPVELNRLVTYKSVLVEGVPNAAMIFGYTNASWTLKADIAAEYVCRLLNHMRARGYSQVVARADAGDRGSASVLGSLNSGYVRRGDALMPRQGTRDPWRVLNNYLHDAPRLRHSKLEDGLLEFSGSVRVPEDVRAPALD